MPERINQAPADPLMATILDSARVLAEKFWHPAASREQACQPPSIAPRRPPATKRAATRTRPAAGEEGTG